MPFFQPTLITLPPVTPLTSLSRRDRSCFATSSRLLAALVNEGLATAVLYSPNNHSQWISIHKNSVLNEEEGRIWVPLLRTPLANNKQPTTVGYLDPEDMTAPISIQRSGLHQLETEMHPATLFLFTCRWNGVQDPSALERIHEELASSVNMQEFAYSYSETFDLPTLDSPAISWERAIVTGHATHPMHKSCVAEKPLAPVLAKDGPLLLFPNLEFVAVPRNDLRITGPFEESIAPLVKSLKSDDSEIIVPCLHRQLPSILEKFPRARVVQEGKVFAEAQTSIRTVKPITSTSFPYHLKLPLACRITSALRTITPWTACAGPQLSVLLKDLYPKQLWIATEIASVVGGQEDFHEAKHLACVIRDDPEERAKEQGETVIIAGALAEKMGTDGMIHAQRIFNLTTPEKRATWFRRYASLLVSLTLPALRDYGISLEGHGQNMLLRVCKETGELKGFVVRDMGGVKIHRPTFQKAGLEINCLPGSCILTDDIREVYILFHHTLIQSHLHRLLRGLGLHSQGWSIVHEEIERICTEGDPIGEFLLAETVPMKCFLRMKLDGLYRDYIHRDIPNLVCGQVQMEE